MFGSNGTQYFLFPWADGGNLWSLWKRQDSYEDRSRIARHHIPRIMDQLIGLADALAKLHKFQDGGSESYRHGDLKPENILVFEATANASMGIWKLADLGLAKYQKEATQNRPLYSVSKTGSGTISYQPPESVTSDHRTPTSRLYDLWSMGCIILQLMTWLMYGTDKISHLTRATNSSVNPHESTYWNASYDAGNDSTQGSYQKVDIHREIKQHMAQMRRDLRYRNALRDLLSIVEDKLLVVKLPSDSDELERGCRTNAADLHQSLIAIRDGITLGETDWSLGDLVKQASTLQLPHGQSSDTIWGNNVSSDSSITTEVAKEVRHYSQHKKSPPRTSH